jgi:hypothetical protein
VQAPREALKIISTVQSRSMKAFRRVSDPAAFGFFSPSKTWE